MKINKTCSRLKRGEKCNEYKEKATLPGPSSQVYKHKSVPVRRGSYHPDRPSPTSSALSPTLPYTLMPTLSRALLAPLDTTRALPLCRHTPKPQAASRPMPPCSSARSRGLIVLYVENTMGVNVLPARRTSSPCRERLALSASHAKPCTRDAEMPPHWSHTR